MSYKVIDDLRQRHVETWINAYSIEVGEHVIPNNGANVRAAIKAGIITGLTIEAVMLWRVPEVNRLSAEVTDVINLALKEPDENLS